MKKLIVIALMAASPLFASENEEKLEECISDATEHAENMLDRCKTKPEKMDREKCVRMTVDEWFENKAACERVRGTKARKYRR
jgi:hypothetical protein